MCAIELVTCSLATSRAGFPACLFPQGLPTGGSFVNHSSSRENLASHSFRSALVTMSTFCMKSASVRASISDNFFRSDVSLKPSPRQRTYSGFSPTVLERARARVRFFHVAFSKNACTCLHCIRINETCMTSVGAQKMCRSIAPAWKPNQNIIRMYLALIQKPFASWRPTNTSPSGPVDRGGNGTWPPGGSL